MRDRLSLRGHWVLFDTSAYFALADEDDANHAAAQALLSRLARERFRSFTTNFILAETHALLLTRLSRDSARRFLQEIDRSITTIVRVTPTDEQRARAIIYHYHDKDFSLTDATSFAVMERLRIGAAFTFDRNFVQYGLTVLAADQW